MIEDGRVDEEALLVTGDFAPPTFDSGGPSFRDASCDQFFDPVLAVARDDRSHLYALAHSVTDAPPGGRCADRLGKRLPRLADRYRQRRRQAPLTGAAKGAVGDDLR